MRGPKVKALSSLFLGLAILGCLFFVWWRLAYVYNLERGHAAMVWKRADFGPIVVDAKSPRGLLAYNLGRVSPRKRLCWMPFNDADLFRVLLVFVVIWGLVHLYLAWYYGRQRAP